MRSGFRTFGILSAVAAGIEGMPFHGYWQLSAAVFWSAVFFFLSRRRASRER